MANQKVSPSLPNSQITDNSKNVLAPKAAKVRFCSYCKQPIGKRVAADRQDYCGKLCAMFGLLIAVYEQDGIDSDVGIDLLCELVNDVLHESDTLLIPKKVRWSDAVDAADELPDGPAGCEFRMVVIDDEGTSGLGP